MWEKYEICLQMIVFSDKNLQISFFPKNTKAFHQND